MENLRPFLSVNSVPVISNLVSKLFYDIIEVTKSKILPLRLQTGRMAKKQKKLGIEFAVFPKSRAESKTTSEFKFDSCDFKCGLKSALRHHRGDEIENFAAAFTDRQDGKKAKKNSALNSPCSRSRM